MFHLTKTCLTWCWSLIAKLTAPFQTSSSLPPSATYCPNTPTCEWHLLSPVWYNSVIGTAWLQIHSVIGTAWLQIHSLTEHLCSSVLTVTWHGCTCELGTGWRLWLARGEVALIWGVHCFEGGWLWFARGGGLAPPLVVPEQSQVYQLIFGSWLVPVS